MIFCAVPMFALRMTTTPIPANVVPAIAKIIIVRRTILASIRNVNAASHIPALQHLMQVSAKDTGTTQRHACARLTHRHYVKNDFDRVRNGTKHQRRQRFGRAVCRPCGTSGGAAARFRLCRAAQTAPRFGPHNPRRRSRDLRRARCRFWQARRRSDLDRNPARGPRNSPYFAPFARLDAPCPCSRQSCNAWHICARDPASTGRLPDHRAMELPLLS